MEISNNFDDLDFFLNKAYLAHISNSKDWYSHRENILKEFLQILQKLEIDYYFDGETYQDLVRNVGFKNRVYLDEIIINNKKRSLLFKNFDLINQKGFVPIREGNNDLFLLNSKRIINIKFRRLPFILKFSSHSLFKNYADLKNENSFIKEFTFIEIQN